MLPCSSSKSVPQFGTRSGGNVPYHAQPKMLPLLLQVRQVGGKLHAPPKSPTRSPKYDDKKPRSGKLCNCSSGIGCAVCISVLVFVIDLEEGPFLVNTTVVMQASKQAMP